jgi:hypothetical protein
MMGMEMLLKGMLGVDPEQLKLQVEQFMQGINAKLEQGVQSYAAINQRLAAIEDRQIQMQRMLVTLIEETTYNYSYRSPQSSELPLITSAQVTLDDVDGVHIPVSGRA